MDKMLYLGMTGAKHTQMAQTVTVNNLANANTPGFRGDFQALLSDEINGSGQFASRINSMGADRASSMAHGTMVATGRELDVAVDGDGWLAVQGANGQEGYSRRGDLQISAEGLLTNGAGQPIMGDGGPITLPPYQSLSLASDGTISIVPMGSGPETTVALGRIKLVTLDESQAMKGDDGLMRQKDGAAGEPTTTARLQSGSLESSNVSAVESLVSMIDLSRQYEMQVRMMQTAKDMSDSGTRMIRME
ncbi:flagellar basal-body rod protein FlgF [Paraperlucidibaca baekdonensis]|uniref:Flagellar basal-body rod protein FlgF n=1 Tax=Paraperlucidibaca baekdonensis TaxID=748120 RepID=A0A3E0H105_9GAMM|nr:flagellar basal body rod protein FlgF [Paraperlucidibaca baekdonensis]REH36743.1 flagellar basal-body rod protein FlgF [Paraperlucidibaca baekdonensis]